jgi:hypothetical protein
MKTKYAAARITIGVLTGFLGAGLGYSAYELRSRLFPQPFFCSRPIWRCSRWAANRPPVCITLPVRCFSY